MVPGGAGPRGRPGGGGRGGPGGGPPPAPPPPPPRDHGGGGEGSEYGEGIIDCNEQNTILLQFSLILKLNSKSTKQH